MQKTGCLQQMKQTAKLNTQTNQKPTQTTTKEEGIQ